MAKKRPQLTQQATVKTNSTKGSILKIDVPSVKFSDLWDAYEVGKPCDAKDSNGKLKYENQCAIRVGVALKKVGVSFESYPKGRMCALRGHEGHALAAENLANWLNQHPFSGLPNKPENVASEDWRDKIKGRTGIVFFENYYVREGQKAVDGDHIDLWNGSRLTTGSGFWTTLARFTFGIRSLWYSDLGKSTRILFWEIK
jgi:hypothetical protein